MNGSILMVITGTITQDPKPRVTKDNNVTNFTVAINRQTSNGERMARFINVAAWGKMGDVVLKNATKGEAIVIQAEWFDLDVYQNNAQMEVNATRITLLPNGRRSDPVDASNGNDSSQVDDIPF